MSHSWRRAARRALAGLVMGVLMIIGVPAQSQDEPLTTLRAERETGVARDAARLAELVADRDALETALKAAREAHDEAEARFTALSEVQQAQQARRDALDERQAEQGEDLSAVLDTLARHSVELRDELTESWITMGGAELPPRLDDAEVLRPGHLETLGDRLMALTAETGRVVAFEAPVAGSDGEVATREVVRLGDLVVFSEGQLLERGAEKGVFATAPRTPEEVSARLADFQVGEGERLALDPTQGQVIAALAQRPSLTERFHQGGAVGYVVVGLGGVGLLVALLQYAFLLRVSVAMRRQLHDLAQPREDNPLGRVLLRFRALADDPVPEALEARLDEAVLAELPRLERGQPLVKLLAAVAPLLGLLGTVTGMIVTFQAITVFGTGDPQLMAGGISQALVTTVLGLITAVPLLFAHTALAGRSRHLTGVMEGQASAALAEQLEQRQVTPKAAGSERRAAALA
ncbi:MAG: MotA/TolQ/ExbB proton channel family protein [Halomonas sp.]|uniref:MotA/TolQ/ExbB proton channel family protein n=1 Tax=Halomonas sp. TaxID=1486246 RepID=UPI002870550D|nr:MotA/TolQ/ExbB proton channel family protein [Halomonas sp.]MDR9440793.1 MotA/TolQ/ExbB proton channel family protein [Halomonas sp.]